jgi:molecular chaperone GrpE
MAKENEDEFLQDISLAEEEMFGEEEHTEEELELDSLKAERDELKDKWMRALADAENSRKRSEKDRREAENYGGSKIARDLLPVYDNLKRGLDVVTDDQRELASALIEGVELTMREIVNVFKKHGIEPIVPEVGDKFNPQDHEAMFEASVPGTKSIVETSTGGRFINTFVSLNFTTRNKLEERKLKLCFFITFWI